MLKFTTKSVNLHQIHPPITWSDTFDSLCSRPVVLSHLTLNLLL